MANRRSDRVTILTLQADGEPGAGNGTPGNTTGAMAVVVFLDAGGTPGTIEMEYSTDSGTEWQALPLHDVDGNPISSTVTENRIVYAQVYDGPSMIRARIPTPWVGGAPLVQAIVVR